MKALVIYTMSNPGLIKGEQKALIIDRAEIKNFATAESTAKQRIAENEKTPAMWVYIEQITLLQPEIDNPNYEG